MSRWSWDRGGQEQIRAGPARGGATCTRRRQAVLQPLFIPLYSRLRRPVFVVIGGRGRHRPMRTRQSERRAHAGRQFTSNTLFHNAEEVIWPIRPIWEATLLPPALSVC